MEVSIKQHQGQLRVRMSGEFELIEGIEQFTQLLLWCRRTRCQAVLADYRRLEGAVSALDRDLLTRALGNIYTQHRLGGGAALRLALVGPAQLAAQEAAMVSQLQARGLETARSSVLAAGLEWLRESSAHATQTP